MRRRRPLLRAAMIGGVGYASYQAGKRGSEDAGHESEQDAQLAALQQEPPYPDGAGDAPPDRFEALSRLKALLDSGALTQEEFDAEKRRILRGS